MGASALMIGLSAASAIGQGVVSYRNSRAQAAALEQQARIAREEYEAQALLQERNASRATDEAEAVTKAGAYEEQKMRDRVRAIRGQQAANYGASGLSLASGTPVQVMADTEVQGAQDVAQYGLNTARKKFALVNQAQDYRTNARLQRQAGANKYNALMGEADAARSAGRNALAGSLFSVAGAVASNWTSAFGKSKSAPSNPWLKYRNGLDWTDRDYLKKRM